MNINGVECHEENGTAYLNLEAVALGLGFTRVAESGNEVVRWERVNGSLKELGFMPTSGHGGYIPENIFYRLAMKAKNETAEKFQALVADEVIPSTRKHGAYLTDAATEDLFTDPDTFATLALKWRDECKARLTAKQTVAAQQEKMALDAPKVLFADSVVSSKSEILVGELSKPSSRTG